jgi:hypothetical protein
MIVSIENEKPAVTIWAAAGWYCLGASDLVHDPLPMHLYLRHGHVGDVTTDTAATDANARSHMLSVVI